MKPIQPIAPIQGVDKSYLQPEKFATPAETMQGPVGGTNVQSLNQPVSGHALVTQRFNITPSVIEYYRKYYNENRGYKFARLNRINQTLKL